MRVVVVAPPAPVVTWEEADRHLKLGGDASQQIDVERFVAAATAHLDGPAGWLGRAIGVQTLEARLDYFDPCGMTLPYAPVSGVTSVKYLDTSNVEQTLAADQYELMGDQLVTAWQMSWPTPLARKEAVRVRYVAGYETLPDPIRAAILLMVGDLYTFRETSNSASSQEVPMSTTVENLLSPFRVYA